MNKYILILLICVSVSGCSLFTCPNTIHIKTPPELMIKPVPLQKL